MKKKISIQELSQEIGVTSRTLRHWESEGLFISHRDGESRWRLYDNLAVTKVKITHALRQLELSIRDIKIILETKTMSHFKTVIEKQLGLIEQNKDQLVNYQDKLEYYLNSLNNLEIQNTNSLQTLLQFIDGVTTIIESKKEERKMIKDQVNYENKEIKFIQLPKMRMVYTTAVGTAPEDEALQPVIEWLEDENLMGTARIFGGNVKPYPSKDNKEYGYGVCASIPKDTKIPSHLKEMVLPGGLYATISSQEDIYNSWQVLMKALKTHSEYIPDRTRLCLEEHIRNDQQVGKGSQFYIQLFEPVKKR